MYFRDFELLLILAFFLQNGDTALHIAAAMGRRKLTRVLLESGCNKDVKNKVCIEFYINLISPAPDTHEKILHNCFAINPGILN